MCGIAGIVRLRRRAVARRAARRDGRRAAAPRPGRRRACGPTARSASATAGCRSSTSPARRSRWRPPTGGSTSSSTARSSTTAQLRARARLPVPHQRRHRGRCWRCSRARRRRRCQQLRGPVRLRHARPAHRRASPGSATGWGSCRCTTALDPTEWSSRSEIKAILPALGGPPRRPRGRWRDYLAGRSVPAPDTLFAGVRKVPPGHFCRSIRARRRHASSRTGRCRRPRRCAGRRRREARRPGRRARCTARCATRLVADVPVGAYLSGGVDSQPHRRHGQPANATTPSCTRSAPASATRATTRSTHAEAVSELVGTAPPRVAVDADDFQRRLAHAHLAPRRADVASPPTSRCSALAEAAREHVKVVLSGEGSDELFAGYPKYRFATDLGAPAWCRRRAVAGCCMASSAPLPAQANRAADRRAGAHGATVDGGAGRGLVRAVHHHEVDADCSARPGRRTRRARRSPRPHRPACAGWTSPAGWPTTSSSAVTGCRWRPRSSCVRRSSTTGWSRRRCGCPPT